MRNSLATVRQFSFAAAITISFRYSLRCQNSGITFSTVFRRSETYFASGAILLRELVWHCCAVAVRNRFIEKQGWALQPPFVHQQADLSGGGRDGHIDG